MSAPPPAKRKTRKYAPQKPGPIVPMIVLCAVEGWGKTTFGAHAPNPVILMARGERGYLNLLSRGRVPSIPAVEITDKHENAEKEDRGWYLLLEWLDSFIADPEDRKTLVVDALGGMERLCHEFVCKTQFHNDWGEHGFASYQKGYDVSIGEWLKMLQRLEKIQRMHGIAIVLLGHSRIKTFKNPMGADYDRYVCDIHDKTWGVTAKQASCVLFGNFYTTVDTEGQSKGKGIGGTTRLIYTERRAAWDAKNQYGMKEQFKVGTDPKEVWNIIWAQITGETA